MSLKNLLRLSLEAVAPNRAVIGRLLAAAGRNLSDARLAGRRAENRFDAFNAAHKAIMQCAMVAGSAQAGAVVSITAAGSDGHLLRQRDFV